MQYKLLTSDLIEMTEMLLGIDLGTSSAKALLLNLDGTVISDVLEALNLRSDWLPPIVPSSAIAGYLTPAASEHLGLPVGLPVIAGAADTAAAALGNGLVEPGLVQLTVGTAAQIITIRSQPILDPQGCTHLYRAALSNQWYSLAAMQNAGLALEWVRNML
jgi:xylulokinase